MGNNKRERRQRAQLARAAGLPPPPPRVRMPIPPITEASSPTEPVSTASSGSPELVATVPVTSSTMGSSFDARIGVHVPWPYTILHDRHVVARDCHLRGELARAREQFEELHEEAKIFYGCADRVTCSIGETLVEIYTEQGDMEAISRLLASRIIEQFLRR